MSSAPIAVPGFAQLDLAASGDAAASAEGTAKEEETPASVPEKVDVDPATTDAKIAARIDEIMEATGWFADSRVRVDRGVAFLEGVADTVEHRQWAEATAIRTTDVVAVVNQMSVAEPPLWNLQPAWLSLQELGRETVSLIPLLVLAILIAGASLYFARTVGRVVSRLTGRRIESMLLHQVISNVVTVLVFVMGVYLALRITGLTRLAVTLLGGTGLVGLALGFAFRDIAENYLASILISLNHPFRVGDLIEVEGSMGFVRKVTTRGTVLNTLEGNQVQIPNAMVYKSKVLNYTATPLMRLSFTVGIGYDDSITKAQGLIMEVLEEHVAVKRDPAPLVLVDSLGASTVNLQTLYWIDQQQHSPLKVGSSVIRQVKERLLKGKITMPDEAREIVFPHGVPVQLVEKELEPTVRPLESGDTERDDERRVSKGEGDLSSERADVMRATANDRTIDKDTNLID